MIWSSPQRLCATSGSRNVTKLKALKGFGMNTSVTSPNFPKYSRKSSAVKSSVHLPINTLHGTCCINPSYKTKHCKKQSRNPRATYFWVRYFNITPPAVDHVSLRQDSHLRFVRRKSDKAKAFWLSGFSVFFHLRHEDFTERFEILTQVLFGGFPR